MLGKLMDLPRRAAILLHGSCCHHSASALEGGALDRQILVCVFCSETLTCLSQSTQFVTKPCTRPTKSKDGGGLLISAGSRTFFFLCVSQHNSTIASRKHRWLEAVSSFPKQEKTRVMRYYIWISLPFLYALSKLCIFSIYLPPCFDHVVHDHLLSFATCPLLPQVGEEREGRALLLRRQSHHLPEVPVATLAYKPKTSLSR